MNKCDNLLLYNIYINYYYYDFLSHISLKNYDYITSKKYYINLL